MTVAGPLMAPGPFVIVNWIGTVVRAVAVMTDPESRTFSDSRAVWLAVHARLALPTEAAASGVVAATARTGTDQAAPLMSERRPRPGSVFCKI